MRHALRLLAFTILAAVLEVGTDATPPILDRRLLQRALVNVLLVAACGAVWLRGRA